MPGEFKVDYIVFTNNYDEYEKKIHNLFQNERYVKNREFFSIDLKRCFLEIRLLLREDIIFEEINFEIEIKNKEIIEEYFTCGKLKITKSIKQNMLWGEYKEYFKNGNIKIRKNYVKNIENGLRREYKKNGSLSKRGQIFNGKKQGEWITFHQLGEEKRYYHDGKPVGKWKIYSKQNKLFVSDYGLLPEGCLEKKYEGVSFKPG